MVVLYPFLSRTSPPSGKVLVSLLVLTLFITADITCLCCVSGGWPRSVALRAASFTLQLGSKSP